MTEKLLIDLSDIKKFRPLSETIDMPRIEPFIREAQRHDLRPLLGDALYYDFIQNFDVTSYNVPGKGTYAQYQVLLNGESYNYAGSDILYDGLVAMLCYYTLARFIPANPVNITKFGATFKTPEQSTPIDAKTMANTVADLRGVAILYSNQLRQYLSINQAKYPLYPRLASTSMTKNSVKFFDPDNSEGDRDSNMYPYNMK